MTFDTADEVEQVAWQLRFGDWPRAQNRARINSLMNGVAPYSDAEVQENNINVNVNYLEGTRLAHDARAQFYQAFLKPGNYFKATSDTGPVHKRQSDNSIVTKEVNRMMKRSIPYFEKHRSTFAQDVLHGIGPGVFRDRDHWCPEPIGVEDVLVPANTKLTMYDLPFFAVYRTLTAPELIKLTRGPKVDKAWNKTLVDACIKYVDDATARLMTDNWPEIWSPEKMEERIKGNSGTFYLGDAVPTINCWDFYYWNDAKNVQGWNRRMIVDAWSTPEITAASFAASTVKAGMNGLRGDFIYNPGDRVYASRREEIVNWQFADLSAVAPFRYHSVRSLGYLLYAVCHLQNRLRCKFNEAVFEQLMVLFRVKSMEDVQRALKVDLINKGFVDDSLEFIKASDRYQVNTDLAQLGLRENQNLISKNSSAYSPEPTGAGSSVEKTKYQVQTEMNAMTSLVSASLLQAYQYQVPEYREIFRRFCKKNSPDPDVRQFQANCLRQGIPERKLHPECWELEPERVMGAGNKTLEVAIANQLMGWRNLYDPEPQREILRISTLAVTDDAGLSDVLVPHNPDAVTDSKFAASLAAGTLMQGMQVPLKTGMNHIEYVETLLTELSMQVRKYQNSVPEGDAIIGMNAIAQHIGQHLAIIAQDKNEKSRVKQYGDALGKMMNEVRAYAQRYLEQQKEKAAQNGGLDPETTAKIQAIKVMAEAKAANTRSSHAERTAQRQLQFEMEEKRKQQEFEAELQRDTGDAKVGLEMQIAQREAQQDMALAEQSSRLDALRTRHEMQLKEREAEQAMRLKEQEADHKLELATKQAEHKIKLEKKMAKAKPAPKKKD